MSNYLDTVKETLGSESFADLKKKCKGRKLEMREEISDMFEDVNPTGKVHLAPEGFGVTAWVTNFIREKGGLDEDLHYRLNYEEFVEWAHRNFHSIDTCKQAKEEVYSSEDVLNLPKNLIKTVRLSYLSHPPAYLVRPDMGFQSVQTMYGGNTTTMYAHIDYWSGEVDWIEGFHNEEGIPVAYWMIGADERIAQHFDEDDKENLLTQSSFVRAPDDPTELLDTKHPQSGVKLRNIPKESPYSLGDWLQPIRGVVNDLRNEMFEEWSQANLYISPSPGNFGTAAQNTIWSISQFGGMLYVGAMGPMIAGLPMQFYYVEPIPEMMSNLLNLTMEEWIKRLGSMFLSGPNWMICDTINPIVTSKEKTPLLHEMRELSFNKGRAYKDFSIPDREGVPPPRAFLTALPAPFYDEVYINKIVPNPDKLPEEYLDLLESEAGLDRETGRIPPFDEVPRIEYLFDPTIEWLQPEDFPPIDWSKGQVWPFDVTREKMEIMVEEGYDGSGEDILHYSALADEKMGQKGETITLGTTSYELPTE